MLALVSFHLVPFVESLRTAPMIALKQDRGEGSRLYLRQETEQLNQRAGLLYLELFLLLAVTSSHVVLHAGMRDEGLWAAFNRTPEDQNSELLQRKGSTLGSGRRIGGAHLCGLSPLWLSWCLVSW